MTRVFLVFLFLFCSWCTIPSSIQGVKGQEENWWKEGNEQLNEVLSTAIEIIKESRLRDIGRKWFGGPNFGIVFPAESCNFRSFIPRKDAKGTLEHVLETGTLRLGSIEVPAMNFEQNGTRVGFEVDLAQDIVETVGGHYQVDLRVEWVIVETDNFFEDLRARLENNEYDAILSFMETTPQREEKVDFSCWYLSSFNVVIRSALDPSLSITSFREINNPNVIIAAMGGSTYEDLANQYGPLAQKILTKDANQSFYLLATNQVHVAIEDFLVLTYLLSDVYTSCNCSILIDDPFPKSNDPGNAMATRKDAQSESKEDANIAIVLGSVFGGLFLLLAIGIGIFIFIYFSRTRPVENEVEIAKDDDLLSTILETKFEVTYNDIELKRKKGSGQYGEVWSALYHGSRVAVKFLKAKGTITQEVTRAFFKEAAVMEAVQGHENIVYTYGVCVKEPNFCIVMEYVPDGTLRDKLRKKGISDEQMAYIILGVAAGLDHIHGKGFVHRDIAARNILLKREDDHFVPKISDFGLSVLSDVEMAGNDEELPLKWMAPEAIESKKFTPASDMWSFGVLIWEMATREKPYQDLRDLSKIKEMIGQGNETLIETVPEESDPVIKKLMKSCWQMEPEKRATAQDIIRAQRNSGFSFLSRTFIASHTPEKYPPGHYAPIPKEKINVPDKEDHSMDDYHQTQVVKQEQN